MARIYERKHREGKNGKNAKHLSLALSISCFMSLVLSLLRFSYLLLHYFLVKLVFFLSRTFFFPLGPREVGGSLISDRLEVRGGWGDKEMRKSIQGVLVEHTGRLVIDTFVS